MVNSVVDGYTKTLNHRKIVREIQKNNNLLETKRLLNQKSISSLLSLCAI